MQLAEEDRCRAMLEQLARQIGQLPADADAPQFEVLVLFDDEEVGEHAVRRFVEPHLATDRTPAVVRYLPSPGLSYYQQKNRGAVEAAGEVVVFLDSDVVPEPGWLRELLGSFADAGVRVVGGNCYLATPGVLSKSLALAWFFPLRSGGGTLHAHGGFFANNVAFRRDLLVANLFEPVEGTSRGACRVLAKRLERQGVTVYQNGAARVSHPAPNGLGHFVRRAIAQGRDELLVSRAMGKRGVVRSVARSLRYQARCWRRVLLRRREVRLPLLATPAAIAIASSYYALHTLGDAMTRLMPRRMGRWFHV